jgi:hypothetical protein
MSNGKLALSLIATFLMVGGALAQSGEHAVQRDINQQKRIEQGLQSGALNTREAARLEREQSQVGRMQANAAKDGKVNAAERARIDAAQNKVSQDIYREKHDAQSGNPNSASSQRMQQSVQRNINQQERIKQGLQSGELTTREAGRLERGEAHVQRMQADAGANGHVGAREQRMVQHAQRHQSDRIYRQKHDEQFK